MHSDEHIKQGDSNLDDSENYSSEEIPTLTTIIPELTDVVQFAEEDIPELTEIVECSEEDIPELTEVISEHELELQQWQIEQQAIDQRDDIGSVAENDHSEALQAHVNEPEISSTDEVTLTAEQQAVLDASWQKLEAFLMEQMPPEIAGTYLSVIEQKIHQSRNMISRDISLLDEDSLDSLLDFYHIDRGF
jgi:hypothetical protein